MYLGKFEASKRFVIILIAYILCSVEVLCEY